MYTVFNPTKSLINQKSVNILHGLIAMWSKTLSYHLLLH